MSEKRPEAFIQCPVCLSSHVPKGKVLGEGIYSSQCFTCGHVFKFRCAPQQTKSNITFTINGKEYTVGNEYNGSTPLNAFLRNTGISRGTKFMCYEGGCGCCVVTVTLYDALQFKTSTYAVNSCLCPLYVCDGWTITTVEGLGNRSKLHPIQQNLMQFSASQCGFCSPGMVMSAYGLLETKTTPGLMEVQNVLDGNICRCTGYRSILDAVNPLIKTPSLRDIEDINSATCRKTRQTCKSSCGSGLFQYMPTHMVMADATWYTPTSLSQLYEILKQHKTQNVRLVFGNTSSGVYGDMGLFASHVIIDVHKVKELYAISFDSTIILGANLSLTLLLQIFERTSSQDPTLQYLKEFGSHLLKVANTPVRNSASWAGNLMLKHAHPEFPSDLLVMFETVGAKLVIGPGVNQYTLQEFLQLDMAGRVIEYVLLPVFTSETDDKTLVKTYKVSPRMRNSQAYVNCGIRMKLDLKKNCTVLERPSVVYGGINPTFLHASKVEEYLTGKQLGDPATLKGALEVLSSELQPEADPVFGSIQYKHNLAITFFYKYVLSACPTVLDPYLSGGTSLVPPVSSGQQTYDTQKLEWPLTEPLVKLEAKAQVTGEAEYIADIAPVQGQLYAAFVISTVGNAQIKEMDATEALAFPGVVSFLRASDIPGVNNCMPNFYSPEQVLSSGQVVYAGQAIGLIVAESAATASMATGMVHVTYTDEKPVILTISDAIKHKSFFPKQADDLVVGNAEEAIANSPRSISGSVHLGAQYHFQMETQISRCTPTEDGVHVISSTQWLDYCQQAVAMTIGIPANSVDVEVRRLGGAYGSKITRNFQVASACALAAYVTNRPVELNMPFDVNMKMIGKRFPWQADYQVGFSEDGKVNGIKITYYCDCGFSPNDSEVGDIMNYADNAYHCENWHLIPVAVKTNCPSHTYCRGPGSTPAVYIMETIMEHIAKSLGKDPIEVKVLNMYNKGQMTPGGMPLTYCSIRELVTKLEGMADIQQRKSQIKEFNQKNRWKKKGMSIVPLKYGVAWSSFNFNVFVAVYNGDGTVAVCHAGIETGQGLNTKVAQVCAYELSIPMELIKVKSSNTLTGANSSMTGASVASELNCQAVVECCKILKDRMAPVKAKMKESSWKELVQKCFSEGVDLSARYWLFPKTKYHSQYNSYGVTCTEAELDVLTGESLLNRVDILFDCGQSINPSVDVGQVEGAFVMGVGYWLLENTVYNPTSGENITSTTWTYKVPSSVDIPADFRVHLLKDAPNPLGVLRSKVSGEPPLCMSCSALFAVKHAIEEARQEIGKDTYFPLDVPATVEKVQLKCLLESNQMVIK